MTIRTSPPISLSDVMAELRVTNPGRAFPISLGDADVRALAGKSSGPVSLSDLYGKSTAIPLSATAVGDFASASTQLSAGTVSCSPRATASGGTGTITYLWEFTSNPLGCLLSSATSASCEVSRTYSRNSTGWASSVLRCTVRDGAGGVIVLDNIMADLEWASNL